MMSKKNRTGTSVKQGKDSLRADRIIKIRLPNGSGKPNPFVSQETGQLLTGIAQPDNQRPDSSSSNPQDANVPSRVESPKPQDSKK